MLDKLTPQPPDKIIGLMQEFRADPRDGKVDLGVGVYKDPDGRTPVMRAVKKAEARLLETQDTKSYVGLLGDADFVAAMRALVLGDAVPADRVCGAQTPGGTGAVHQLLELAKLAEPGARVWHSQPTWPNHVAIARHLGLEARPYRYFDAATGRIDFAGMAEDLRALGPGDLVILHGCCHNPTGANPTTEEWAEVTAILKQTGALPLVDFAYQGFGDGLEADAAGVRAMVAELPRTLIAVSCSKNFGLYRDRVGAALAVTEGGEMRGLTEGALASLNRVNFSFPPDHGAKVVEIILNDPGLRADWEAELSEMRARMLRLREGLAEALRRATNDNRFDFVAEHRGMFSLLGLPAEKVERMREEAAIYMVGDSRFNVAGLPEARLDELARAIAAA